MSRLISAQNAVLFLLCMLLSCMIANASFAQPQQGGTGIGTGTTTTTSSSDCDPTGLYFAINGVPSLWVDASGGLKCRKTASRCPFEPQTTASITNWGAASTAAKGGDPDSCPYALSGTGEKFYLFQCEAFYKRAAQRGPLGAKDSTSSTDASIACCHLPPGLRDACKAQYLSADESSKLLMAKLATKSNVKLPFAGVQSKTEIEQLDKHEEEEKQAWQQCFSGTRDRIQQYWAGKRAGDCVRTATRFIKNQIKALIAAFSKRTVDQGQLVSNAPAPSIYGTTTYVSEPKSIAGALLAKIADAALLAGELADKGLQVKDYMDKCSKIIPGLKEVNDWVNGSLNNICQQAESLVERQLTQCIRIDVGVNLTLPQFSIMLQCPININISAQLNNNGFNFACNTTVQSPGSIGFGGSNVSLFSNMPGGLENLFNGGCFRGNSTAISTAGPFSQGNLTTGERTPGVDCGPRTSDPARETTIKGLTYLSSKTPVATGWVVGDSETVDGQQITRCDYFQSRRITRTVYVYGSGASCNAGASGFLSGQYETNTTCYSGGYTPVQRPSVPDGCLFEPACLDTNGVFVPGNVGTVSGCSSATPDFQSGRTYKTYTTGGIGPTQVAQGQCTDFDGLANEPVICCDPQKQDCSQKDANTPYCQCDEGDGKNYASSNPALSCIQGGTPTCCSVRLNGTGGCDTAKQVLLNPPAGSSIPAFELKTCAAEVAECTPGTTQGTWTGPDGTDAPMTAAQLSAAKPSPYIYLFVRPDAQIPSTSDGEQCCMTEWCNVCPQQYANAYGLSLDFQNSNAYINPQGVGGIQDKQFDSTNNNIIGKGWPFVAVKDESTGSVTYNIGLNKNNGDFQLPGAIVGGGGENDWSPIHYRSLPFMLSDSMQAKPSPSAMAACNRMYASNPPTNRYPISGGNNYWVTGYAESQRFGSDGDMGYAYDYNSWYDSDDEKFVTFAPVKMTETPLAYLNRLRSAYTESDGKTPLAPIKLCSDVVKLCLPQANINLGGGSPSTPGTTPIVVPSTGSTPTTGGTGPTTTPTTTGGTAPLGDTGVVLPNTTGDGSSSLPIGNEGSTGTTPIQTGGIRPPVTGGTTTGPVLVPGAGNETQPPIIRAPTTADERIRTGARPVLTPGATIVAPAGGANAAKGSLY